MAGKEEPKLDLKVLDASILKVLAYKPKLFQWLQEFGQRMYTGSAQLERAFAQPIAQVRQSVNALNEWGRTGKGQQILKNLRARAAGDWKLPVAPIPPLSGKMTGKYKPLYNYLVRRRQEGHTPWHASFKDVETIVGAPLPHSARTWRAWWSNHRKHGRQSSAWLLAGWEKSDVDMKAETVLFRVKT